MMNLGHSPLLPGQRSAAPWRFWKKSPPSWANSSSALIADRQLGGAGDVLPLDGHGQRMRERFDREHAGDLAVGVDDRPVLGVGGQEVRQRVAQDVVELDDRLGGRAEVLAHALALEPAL